MRPNVISIGNFDIGSGSPCFVIAEAGVNHNGDVHLARQLVEVASAAGADAVKFQTFSAERLVTRITPKAPYQLQSTGTNESQFDMLKRLELSVTDHKSLKEHAAAKRIVFMSTPFDGASADLLDEMDLPVFKVPSGEITNLPFLKHIAKKRKPIILSTGMSTLGEVETAVNAIRGSGNNKIVLLHCVSNYPTDPAEANLRAMETMRLAFGTPVGYSDHSSGIEVALAAVALGACVIEKHFTLDRTLPGPDHVASLEPAELAALVSGIRKVESALGTGMKMPAPSEIGSLTVARKSLVSACPISAGTVLTSELIAVKRPGTGLPPAMLPFVLGRTVRVDLPEDTVLEWSVLS